MVELCWNFQHNEVGTYPEEELSLQSLVLDQSDSSDVIKNCAQGQGQGQGHEDEDKDLNPRTRPS